MKKIFKKKPGIMSSRVVVKPHVSWQSRFLFIVVICLLLLLLSWSMFEAGRRTVGAMIVSPETKLNESFDVSTCLQQNREALCAQFAELSRKFQIVQTTNNDLIIQTRILSRENDQLKEELDFFEHVIGGNTKIESGVSIHHFNLKKDVNPGVYRYAISLVQGGQRPKDFEGKLKFFVTLQQNDQQKTVLLTKKDAQQNFSVRFKFYHRIEETFKVPSDAIVKSMKVQVFEQDDAQVKLTQTVEPAL